MRTHGSPAELEAKRMSAIGLLNDGLLPHEVAQRLGLNRRTVRKWKSLYRRKGKEALRAKPVPGRPLKMGLAERRELRKILLRGAHSSGFGTDLWTCLRVATVVKRKFGVSYHRAHLGRLMRGLGLTPQRPVRRAVERDEKRIRGWVATRWAGIKKNSGN